MITVIAKLDKSSRARLSWIQSFAASFGICPKPIYGHITLAELEGDRETAAARCRAALAGQEPFAVDFQTVAVLDAPRAVAALAAGEGALEAVHDKLAPGRSWTPCTVLLEDAMTNLNWVRMAMGEMFQPFTATVDRIELMEGAEIFDSLDLKGEDA